MASFRFSEIPFFGMLSPNLYHIIHIILIQNCNIFRNFTWYFWYNHVFWCFFISHFSSWCLRHQIVIIFNALLWFFIFCLEIHNYDDISAQKRGVELKNWNTVTLYQSVFVHTSSFNLKNFKNSKNSIFRWVHRDTFLVAIRSPKVKLTSWNWRLS